MAGIFSAEEAIAVAKGGAVLEREVVGCRVCVGQRPRVALVEIAARVCPAGDWGGGHWDVVEVLIGAESPACAAQFGGVAVAGHVAVRFRGGFGRQILAAVALSTVLYAEVRPVAAEGSAGFDGHGGAAGGAGAIEDTGGVVDVATLVGEGGG